METPYYAVIFTSIRNEDEEGYTQMAKTMETLAKQQSGFLGLDSVRNELGITISYWKNLESIRMWKEQSDHKLAQELGKTKWYAFYNVKICKVEKEYTFKV